MSISLNRKVFQNQTFDSLDETIICSSFNACTFTNIGDNLVFDRCNLKNCKFDKPCKFTKCIVINEQLEEKPAEQNLLKSGAPKKAMAKNAVTVSREASDAALKKSTFNKSNYATVDDTSEIHFTPYTEEKRKAIREAKQKAEEERLSKRRELRNGKHFEALNHAYFVMAGNKGITRGDHVDELYANSLVERGMDAFPSDRTCNPPYVIDTYRYVKENGEGKKVLVDLTKITENRAIEQLQKNNIEIKEYYFTMTNIHYLDAEEKVLVADLTNDEDAVNFQCMIDVRNSFGRIAIKLNIDIDFGDEEQIICKDYKDGLVTSFIEE